jgi:DNA-binding NarL/FixJ family response regulator
MNIIRFALVDDHKLFRESLSTMLAAIPKYKLVMEAENGLDCLEKLKSMGVKPDIILMDMEMPVMDGTELNEQLQKMYPSIKRIILSVCAKERLMARMIESGASGYLVKNCGKEELYTAINSVFTNGFYMSTEVMKALQNTAVQKNPIVKNVHNIPIELTTREMEVLQYVCKEYSNMQIAEKLFISVRTVEGHRTNLLLKTGCKNTAGLALFAVKYNIFELVF